MMMMMNLTTGEYCSRLFLGCTLVTLATGLMVRNRDKRIFSTGCAGMSSQGDDSVPKIDGWKVSQLSSSNSGEYELERLLL